MPDKLFLSQLPVFKAAKWYMTQMCGFAKDGRAMYFFFGNELEDLPDDARKLISNPQELEEIDPEMDMFVWLCRFK